MANELCMNCFQVKGRFDVCPYCGYAEGTPPKQPHYLLPGMILAGHFIVGTVIGAGGFGIIYKCYDTTLGVIVAVKEFYPVGLVNRAPGQRQIGLLSGGRKLQYEKQRKRFLMEAQSIAQFGKAKDIVNVYDYFEENNTAYIIMEFVDGVLLKDYLESKGKLSVEASLLIVGRIITAVKKIHAKGIIHRDISPDNIFITQDDNIKIFDFGAAQLGAGQDGTEAEQVVKMGYSAPEQYRDKAKQGFYTDIYSVGAIFYQMVTGVKPMGSTDREYKDGLKSPLNRGIQIEKNLDRTIMEAMAVKPELRFQGIQQLEDAIQGKRLAEYPEVKIKRRRRKRNGFIAAVVTAVLAISVGIGLFSTVLKSKNPVTEMEITQTEITVWVDSQKKEEFIKDFVEEAFHRDAAEEDTEQTRRILEENKRITVTVKNAVEKGGTMEQALNQARGKTEFPDAFLTDSVENLGQYELLSYRDNIYEAIHGNLDEYLYLSSYSTYFPDMIEMPTGLDALLYYAIHRGNGNGSQFYAESQDRVTLDVSEILKAAQTKESCNMSVAAAVDIAPFLGDSGFDYKEGNYTFGTDFEKNLAELLTARKKTLGTKPWKNKKSDTGHSLYGNGYFGGVGFRKEVYGLATGSEEEIKGQDAYRVFVPVVNGKMLLQYCDKYAINGASGMTEEKKNACVRFIWSLMGQDASGTNEDTVLPISKKGFETYMGFNTPQSGLQQLIQEEYPCEMVGRGTGKVERFAEIVQEKLKEKKTLSAADIRECEGRYKK